MEDINKLELLNKLLDKQLNGINLSKAFDVESGLSELQEEYKNILENEINNKLKMIEEKEKDDLHFKMSLLCDLGYLENQGYKLTRKYNLNCDIKEMEYEYNLINLKIKNKKEKEIKEMKVEILKNLSEIYQDKFKDLYIDELWKDLDMEDKIKLWSNEMHIAIAEGLNSNVNDFDQINSLDEQNLSDSINITL